MKYDEVNWDSTALLKNVTRDAKTNPSGTHMGCFQFYFSYAKPYCYEQLEQKFSSYYIFWPTCQFSMHYSLSPLTWMYFSRFLARTKPCICMLDPITYHLLKSWFHWQLPLFTLGYHHMSQPPVQLYLMLYQHVAISPILRGEGKATLLNKYLIHLVMWPPREPCFPVFLLPPWLFFLPSLPLLLSSFPDVLTVVGSRFSP